MELKKPLYQIILENRNILTDDEIFENSDCTKFEQLPENLQKKLLNQMGDNKMIKVQKNLVLEEINEKLIKDMTDAFTKNKIEVIHIEIQTCKDPQYGTGLCLKILTKDQNNEGLGYYGAGQFLFQKGTYEKGFYINENKFEIYPLQDTQINGQEIKYFIKKTTSWNEYGMAQFVLDVFKKYDICAYEEHHWCNHSCIIMPKSKATDFFIDNAQVIREWQHLRTDKILERYNMIYNKNYQSINEMLYNWWSDWKGKPLTEICKVDIDGMNIGGLICDKTFGKYLVCFK